MIVYIFCQIIIMFDTTKLHESDIGISWQNKYIYIYQQRIYLNIIYLDAMCNVMSIWGSLLLFDN